MFCAWLSFGSNYFVVRKGPENEIKNDDVGSNSEFLSEEKMEEVNEVIVDCVETVIAGVEASTICYGSDRKG